MDVKTSIKDASKKLDLPEQTLRLALQQGQFKEFGIAIKQSKEYSYYINKKRLDAYLEGRYL